MQCRRILAILALASGLVGGGASIADASHFRYGHITWVPRADLGPLTVEFTVLHGWRRSACPGTGPGGFVAVGDPACAFSSLDPGDGGFSSVTGVVVSIDPAADWYLARYTTTHTYASANNGGSPWRANISNCCRIYAPQVNAPGTAFLLETTVDLSFSNASPVSTVFPIVPMVVNALNLIPLPVGDVDGDTVTCRLATFPESLIATQPGPPNGGAVNALTVTPNCILSWDTTGTSVGQLWATQIVILDARGGNPPHGRTALEFLIEIVPTAVGNPPQCDSPPTPTGTVTIQAGSPYTATIQGSDPDLGDTLTLNSTGVPAGATMTPPLPTSSASPVSSVLNWTPTTAQVGPHPLQFSVTDQNGNAALCSFLLVVSGCGDNTIQLGEQCDGTSDAACPGQCLPPGDPNQCRCPTIVSTSTTTSSIITTTTSTSTTTTIADHFKCYKTRTQPFARRTVTLVDQFTSSTATVIRPERLCNPADKNGEGISDPTAHLMCYQIREGSFTRRDALVRNQFGDQTVTVVKPESLCNPADKDGIPRQTNGNHFKCYRVRAPSFTALTANVADQFETQVTTLVKLRMLCNPVDKNGEGIVDPEGHLACYTIKRGGPSFTPRNVTVMDQFAQQDLDALRGECRRRSLLCVPSEKNPTSPSGAFLEPPTGALL